MHKSFIRLYQPDKDEYVYVNIDRIDQFKVLETVLQPENGVKEVVALSIKLLMAGKDEWSDGYDIDYIDFRNIVIGNSSSL